MECIAANPKEARLGVSRSTIKRFAAEKYSIEPVGLNISMLNRAIAHGAEKGDFVLPKGPSGKVRLAPKVKANTSSKEVSIPRASSSGYLFIFFFVFRMPNLLQLHQRPRRRLLPLRQRRKSLPPRAV